MRNPIRDLCFFAIAFTAAFSLGCSQPFTDIVATNSSDVGAWDVSNAQVNGTQLTADVCMDRIDEADAISERLLFQLRNKGYDRIQLALYAPDGAQTRTRQVTWSTSTGRQMQGVSDAGENPCAARPQDGAAHEPGARAEGGQPHDAAH